MISCVQSNKKDVFFILMVFRSTSWSCVSLGSEQQSFCKQICAAGFKLSLSDSPVRLPSSFRSRLRRRQEHGSRHAAKVRQCLPSKCGRGVKKEHLVAVRCAALDSRTHSAHPARIRCASSRNTNSRTLHLEGSCWFRGCRTRLIDENCSGQSRSPSDKEPFRLRRAAQHRRPCRTSPRTLTTTRGPRLRSRTTTFRHWYSGFCWLWSSPAGTCSCASACTWRKL